MTEYLDRAPDLDDPRIASAIDELSVWSSRFGALLLDHLELRRGLRVLDLGCGTGFPLVELAQRLGASCRVVGVDLWEAALRRAALKRELHGLDQVALLLADGARLPLRAACFDLVVSKHGINNFDDPPAVLAECARVLEPGGRLALTTNVEGHMGEFYEVLRRVLVEARENEALERMRAHEAHRLSRGRIEAMLAETGFRPLRAIEDRFRMRYLDGSSLLRHSLTRLGFLDGWRAVVGPEDERAIFYRVEAELNRLAERQGELRMTVPVLFLEAERSPAVPTA